MLGASKVLVCSGMVWVGVYARWEVVLVMEKQRKEWKEKVKRERKRDKERKSLGCMLREELKGKSCSYFPIKIMTFLCSSDPKTSGQAPIAASEGNAALRAFVLFCVWGFDCF